MSVPERDEIPMLFVTPTRSMDNDADSEFRRWPRARSASLSTTMTSMESHERETSLVGHTGPLTSQRTPLVAMSGPLSSARRRADSLQRSGQLVNGQREEVIWIEKFSSATKETQNEWPNDKSALKNEHLLRSGQLGMCNDPYCTTCPSYYHHRENPRKPSKASSLFDSHFHSAYGDAKGWARRFFAFLGPCIPGVINPHAQFIQRWNKFFVISCLFAIFVDPLFFFLLSVQENDKCIVLDWTATKALVVFRSLTDFVYLLHILLQFRLAFVAPESTDVGAGELVDHPTEIARNYIRGYFFLDLFIVLPLPQIIILLVLPDHLGISGANYAKNLLRLFILIQYIPRLYRFLPLLANQSSSGLIFESAWANFIINLLTFVLAGHIVGSGWYLFGLQRVNQCLRDACRKTDNHVVMCKFIDCGHGSDRDDSDSNRRAWRDNVNASACLTETGFAYGVYVKAVTLTTKDSIIERYVYSLFWGFQQISTLAGNQVPSYFVWEVLFTMGIIGLGLLLFALLIGNMQNFLQALGRRRLEMSLRRRDVEQWMSHRRLPVELRRKVREAERYSWAATRGVNEEMLLDNLPEDLQRDIRRYLFRFVKKVRIFALMDEPIIDAICEKLRQKTYIKGSKILYRGGLVEKMTFVVRGKMESSAENGIADPLSERDVCGEELLTWCLEHSSVNKDAKKIRIPGKRLLSNRTVVCLTNVEAFSLRAADLEEVTSLYSRLLRNPRVKGAIRYESPYWRGLAASRIQVAWRYWKKRLNRADTSQSSHSPTKNI